MRSIWYGDKRDIVKWSVLLQLAKKYRLRVIVQICFLTPYKFPAISLDGEHLPVPSEVIQHFRTIRSVESISTDVRVAVFDQPFNDRRDYLSSALEFVTQFDGQPRLVFLDPDTGLAPRRADITHVTESEVHAFWSNLSPGDMLVVYQHKTNRSGKPWIEEKQQQLALVTGVDRLEVKVAEGNAIANDVVFFFIRKA